MNKFDLSDNQYWLLFWTLIVTLVVAIGVLINNNTKHSRQIELDYSTEMLSKGYIQVNQITCQQQSQQLIWTKGLNEHIK